MATPKKKTTSNDRPPRAKSQARAPMAFIAGTQRFNFVYWLEDFDLESQTGVVLVNNQCAPNPATTTPPQIGDTIISRMDDGAKGHFVVTLSQPVLQFPQKYVCHVKPQAIYPPAQGVTLQTDAGEEAGIDDS